MILRRTFRRLAPRLHPLLLPYTCTLCKGFPLPKLRMALEEKERRGVDRGARAHRADCLLCVYRVFRGVLGVYMVYIWCIGSYTCVV